MQLGYLDGIGEILENIGNVCPPCNFEQHSSCIAVELEYFEKNDTACPPACQTKIFHAMNVQHAVKVDSSKNLLYLVINYAGN